MRPIRGKNVRALSASVWVWLTTSWNLLFHSTSCGRKISLLSTIAECRLCARPACFLTFSTVELLPYMPDVQMIHAYTQKSVDHRFGRKATNINGHITNNWESLKTCFHCVHKEVAMVFYLFLSFCLGKIQYCECGLTYWANFIKHVRVLTRLQDFTEILVHRFWLPIHFIHDYSALVAVATADSLADGCKRDSNNRKGQHQSKTTPL